jgi:hypothetical protein
MRTWGHEMSQEEGTSATSNFIRLGNRGKGFLLREIHISGPVNRNMRLLILTSSFKPFMSMEVKPFRIG